MSGSFGFFFAGRTSRGEFVNQKSADNKDDNPKISEIGLERIFTVRQFWNQPGTADTADGQADAQGRHQPSHTVVIERRNRTAQPDQPLVGNPDGIRQQFVDRITLAERLGIIGQSEDGDVPHTGHNAAESTHG